MKQNEVVLGNASRKIKNTVIELSEKINQQDLIIESIENETQKNSNLMIQNMYKFEKILDIMNNDPRNKIILFLLIIALILTMYLIY